MANATAIRDLVEKNDYLQQDDGVGISFWIISIAMIAATVFFFAEAGTVNDHWKTSLHVGGLVTLAAGVHYMHMREYWVHVHQSPRQFQVRKQE